LLASFKLHTASYDGMNITNSSSKCPKYAYNTSHHSLRDEHEQQKRKKAER